MSQLITVLNLLLWNLGPNIGEFAPPKNPTPLPRLGIGHSSAALPYPLTNNADDFITQVFQALDYDGIIVLFTGCPQYLISSRQFVRTDLQLHWPVTEGCDVQPNQSLQSYSTFIRNTSFIPTPPLPQPLANSVMRH